MKFGLDLESECAQQQVWPRPTRNSSLGQGHRLTHMHCDQQHPAVVEGARGKHQLQQPSAKLRWLWQAVPGEHMAQAVLANSGVG